MGLLYLLPRGKHLDSPFQGSISSVQEHVCRVMCNNTEHARTPVWAKHTSVGTLKVVVLVAGLRKMHRTRIFSNISVNLTLSLLMSYIYIYDIYGAPCKARNFNVVYIWTYVWQC
jgi:hypothetical protein